MDHFMAGLLERSNQIAQATRYVPFIVVPFVLGIVAGSGLYIFTPRNPAVDNGGPPSDFAEPQLPPPSPVYPPERPSVERYRAISPEEPATDAEAQIEQVTAQGVATETMVSQHVDTIPCAVLATSIRNGIVDVVGYLGSPTPMSDVQTSLNEFAGVKHVYVDGVEQFPSAYCNIMDALSILLLNRIYSGSTLSIQNTNDNSTYFVGEDLSFFVNSGSRESYIYVDYFSVEGVVVHMLPNASEPLRRFPADQKFRVGDGEFGSWIIGQPVGTEAITVIVSPQPLVAAARPEIEDAETYLAELVPAIEAIQQDGATGDTLAADVLFITTKEKMEGL